MHKINKNKNNNIIIKIKYEFNNDNGFNEIFLKSISHTMIDWVKDAGSW